ncbi:MAG: putative sulfate exporter family transporter [Nakamurella sp.]
MKTISHKTLEHGTRAIRIATWLLPKAPGLAVAALAVGVAFTINRFLPALSPLTIAVILGAILGNLGVDFTILKPGLKFAAKKLLRAGIVLLGLKLAVGNVLQLGGKGLAVVAAVVTITFFGTQLIGRAMGVSPGARLLIATGFSICGASAVAAMDGVIHEKEEDVITAIALVTMCGSLAIVVLPLLQHPLGLSDTAFGTWTGASVHDVAQVVATASVVGPAALAPAVIVKLTRVVLLAPIVAGMSLWRRRSSKSAIASVNSANMGEKRPPILPLFVIGFLAMIAVRSTGILPVGVLNVTQTLEGVLLAAALFGLGSSVHLKTLFTTGGRALALGLVSWIMIAAVAYGGVLLVGA